MTHAIVARDVNFAYTTDLVIEKASFSIEKGEWVGIIGPNGSGKTTLMKLLLGLLEPTSGTIQIFGKDPFNNPIDLSYVPQTQQLDKKFPITVNEIVLSGRLKFLPFSGRYSEEDRHIAFEALKSVKLEAFQHRPFGALSTGQAQRVLVARALASNPSILFLDEPTASVDSESAEEIYALLRSLKGSVTIVMITHDLDAIIRDTTRVLCVQRKVTSFTPEEVCRHFTFGLYHTPIITEIGKHGLS